MSEANCPRCGRPITQWGGIAGREWGYCACNPAGPVLDRPAPVAAGAAPAQTGIELLVLPGINLEIMGALVERGYTTIAQVQAATDEALLAISGIGPVRLAKIRGIIHSGDTPLG